MVKSVIIFGLGTKGKKVIEQCLAYASDINIIAIVDNNSKDNYFHNIAIIRPEHIKDYVYDEIWICTVYYKEIREQLISEYGINTRQIYYEDVVMPVLDERIRKKYIDSYMKIENDYPLDYILNGRTRMYSYPFFDEYLNKPTVIFFDDGCGMYYTIYNGKRMYMERSLDTEEKARFYVNQMLMEQDERCPHCYWNFEELRNVSGNVVDVGAAEGIWGLKIIDQVQHLYMIEIDHDWIEALKKTYEQYKDKVTIIEKYVSDRDEQNNAKIDTLFKNIDVSAIKMDIEGVEMQALKGAEDKIKKDDILLAICTYHHSDDNRRISEFLSEKGYECHNSDGWVVCQGDWELDSDETDFRRALAFAKKRSEI